MRAWTMSRKFIREALFNATLTRHLDVKLEDGTACEVILIYKDKEGKELGAFRDDAYVQSNHIAYKFNVEDIANELKLDEDKIDFLTVAVDIDVDSKIAKGKELKVKILPLSKLNKLYFSPIQKGSPLKYKVKQGDNLSSIAKRFNTTVQSITTLNQIPNSNLIYPNQELLIESKTKKSDLQKVSQREFSVDEDVNVVLEGTPNAEVEVRLLNDVDELLKFTTQLNSKGKSIVEVKLRPNDEQNYKELLKRYEPQVNRPIKRDKLTLKAEINEKNHQFTLENDDNNTLGLKYYQLYIKEAHVVDKVTQKKVVTLRSYLDIETNEIVFSDADTNEPIAKTKLDQIVNLVEDTKNAAGGLAAGMQKVDGSFALANSKGLTFTHYPNAWGGNQYIQTYKMAKIANGIDKGSFALSLVIGAYQIDSASQKDEIYLERNNIQKADLLPDLGEGTEKQIGNTFAGFIAGERAIKLVALGVVFLPFELSVAATLGVYIVIGGVTGWLVSKAGEELVDFTQDIKGSTIIHDYPLKPE